MDNVEQKIEVLYTGRIISTIQPLLDEGWKVVMMCNEIISNAGGGGSPSVGRIVFILERHKSQTP